MVKKQPLFDTKATDKQLDPSTTTATHTEALIAKENSVDIGRNTGLNSNSKEEKMDLASLEELEEEDLVVIDTDETEMSSEIKLENFTPTYFKEQGIFVLEEINLEALLKAIAKRGNQIEDQKIEDEAQYALDKINNNLANEKITLRQKVIIDQQERYLGTASTIQDLFDLLYLRKNRRENVIKDINVTDIIYNKEGYIQGFSYNISK